MDFAQKIAPCRWFSSSSRVWTAGLLEPWRQGQGLAHWEMGGYKGWEKLFSPALERELFQPNKAVAITAREERHDHAEDLRRARRHADRLVGFRHAAFADTMTMWVRASGTNAAAHLVDLWNATHGDKIELTTIPDNQMVTKLATGVQAGEVPDLVSFDLIYMPDFMKAGFLTDLTADLKANPNYASVAQAYKDIATYEGKIYGAGFTPDVSILIWNKDLFKKAGLDPDKPPRTIGEIHEDAKKIHALGPDTYGFYFSGSCPGCNIFTTSPMMVAAGSKILPANGDDPALTGDGVKDVLETFKAMWDEGLVPKSAQTDNGANFSAVFKTGKIGIQGSGGFIISDLKHDVPNLNFGVTFLPGVKEGQVSAFVGGDVVAIPEGLEARAARQAVHRLGADRRSPARGARQEQHPAFAAGACRQQVFRRRSAHRHHRESARRRLCAVGLSFRRHGQFGLEPVDQHDAARDLRRRRRRGDQGRAREDEGDRRPSERPLALHSHAHETARPFGNGRAGSIMAPALLFVGVFVLIPLGQLVAMSLTDRSLLGGGKFIGLSQLHHGSGTIRASGGRSPFTAKYTLVLTPILMVLGFALALLTADNTPLKRLTRAIVFLPVVIGLSSSSLLWFWLFDEQVGLLNKLLVDLRVIAEPIVWFASADLAFWAVVISITWKVVGFGMVLFIAGIQSINPRDPRGGADRRRQATGSASVSSSCR